MKTIEKRSKKQSFNDRFHKRLTTLAGSKRNFICVQEVYIIHFQELPTNEGGGIFDDLGKNIINCILKGSKGKFPILYNTFKPKIHLIFPKYHLSMIFKKEDGGRVGVIFQKLCTL